MIQTDRLSELRKARARKELAEQNFNNADSEFVEAAVFEMKAAEEKFNVLLHEVKLLQQ